MRVRLIAKTVGVTSDGPTLSERVCGSSARSCYSDKPSSELMQTDTKGALRRAVESGHLSVLEHASYTFSVEGVSRVETHQHIRHRIAAYSQMSQRYVKSDGVPEIVTPRSVVDALKKEAEETNSRYDEHLNNAYENYRFALGRFVDELREKGIPEEDIRYFYPQGTATNITFTMNLRELSHFLGIRRCTRAQEEIRMVADAVAEIMERECPFLAELNLFEPQCVRLGYCPEGKMCCGRARPSDVGGGD